MHSFNRTFNTSIYKSKRNKGYIFFLYAISPFLTLLIAIKNYKASWAKDVVWLFVAFYGYTMVISVETMDANRYRDWFLQLVQSDMTFAHFIDLLYSQTTNYVDILQPVISFLVSRITSDYHILFLVFGFVFGYFYSRNIWYLIDKSGYPLKRESILLIIVFACIIGFWDINGFRMWTATHIFFYGTIRYLCEKKKKGLIIAVTSIFVHFSFIFSVLILVIFVIIKEKVHIYFWMFIITFFVAEIDLELIRKTLFNFAPDFLNDRITNYTSEDKIESLKETYHQLSWHAQYYAKVLKWVIFTFIIVLYFKGLKFIKANKILNSLYSFSLLFLAFANIVSFLPSGIRFVSVAILFALSTIFFYTQFGPKEQYIRKISPLAIIALLFYCVVKLRIGFNTIGVITILGNPLLSILMDIDIALIEFIK